MSMIKALVSLNMDLASSIALRYSCRLAEIIGMKLHTMHVEEVDKEGYSPGTGWVRSTWEKGLLQTSQEEILQLINTEKSSCPSLDAPIIRIGEREEELLHEIDDGSYDLFIEGVLHSFNAVNFYKKIQSKLYRYASCPIIIVKNLVDLNSIALLLGDDTDVRPLITSILKIFTKSELTVDLIHYTFQKFKGSVFREKVDDSKTPGRENGDKVLGKAEMMLSEMGCYPKDSWVIQDSPKKIADFLGGYGLVAAYIPSHSGMKNRLIELLSQVPSATLLCRR
ncbi:MAG: universal stress protein [Deltaproteobacteria bacterium]|nr:universal stress protein [Deltaproteobacteria bacterium]